VTLTKLTAAGHREFTLEERLQKLIARAGIASRRTAEKLILAGEVTVNGKVVAELGSKADPERDSIKVSGRLLRFPEEKTYLLLNKPSGCVSTMNDPEGRRTVRDLLRGIRGHVFPVGRLEYHSEGLLLLTSDGELADRLMRGSLPQVYWLKVKGKLSIAELQDVAAKTGARLRLVKPGPNPWYEASVTEARRDALRNGLFRIDHPVEKLRRVRLANLELGKLAPAEYRQLTAGEVAALVRAASKTDEDAPPRGRTQRARRAS
jgi:23S rRNA pseudouridine2605 synthase